DRLEVDPLDRVEEVDDERAAVDDDLRAALARADERQVGARLLVEHLERGEPREEEPEEDDRRETDEEQHLTPAFAGLVDRRQCVIECHTTSPLSSFGRPTG